MRFSNTGENSRKPGLGLLFLQYLGTASVLRKQSLRDRKIPSATVTSEIFLYSITSEPCLIGKKSVSESAF